MEFQFQDVKQGFTSPDFLYNFEPAGDLASKYNAPPAPNSIENLAADYIQRQRQVADAIAQQHRIDNIYERVMNEAPRRDVEVLAPDNPAEVFNPNKTRIKNITPVEQQQEISELLERQVKRPSTPSPATPPIFLLRAQTECLIQTVIPHPQPYLLIIAPQTLTITQAIKITLRQQAH